jgi:hypothetical protein
VAAYLAINHYNNAAIGRFVGGCEVSGDSLAVIECPLIATDVRFYSGMYTKWQTAYTSAVCGLLYY